MHGDFTAMRGISARVCRHSGGPLSILQSRRSQGSVDFPVVERNALLPAAECQL